MEFGELPWNGLVIILMNACKKVSNKGVLSDAFPISHGVPKGNILGPLLFILFIDDLPKRITNCKIALYADDTVLLFSAKTSEEIRVNIQEDLDRAIKWFKENRLHLNVKKDKMECVRYISED